MFAVLLFMCIDLLFVRCFPSVLCCWLSVFEYGVGVGLGCVVSLLVVCVYVCRDFVYFYSVLFLRCVSLVLCVAGWLFLNRLLLLLLWLLRVLFLCWLYVCSCLSYLCLFLLLFCLFVVSLVFCFVG